MVTKDDIETMRILFGADINELCNQSRWKEAKEMEQIRDRIMKSLNAECCNERPCLNELCRYYQGPCEDVISRQTVIDAIKEYASMIWEKYREPFPESTIMEIIQALPPVTAQPKIGHWIDIVVGDMLAQACDQCNTFYPLSYTGGGHKYCPNCGAKMGKQG